MDQYEKEPDGSGCGPEGRKVESQIPNSAAPERNRTGSRKKEMGCVYFIKSPDGTFVKIGYTGLSVLARFRSIGNGLPGLRLLGYIPGTRETETWLHLKFAGHRENGEWFRFTDEVEAFLANIGLIQPPIRTIITGQVRKRLPELARATGEGSPASQSSLSSDARAYFREQGARGGKIGLAARMGKVSPERRSAIARNAVQVREQRRRNQIADGSR